ncbi:MAG: MTH1187 family thiamine-binding protein [Cyanobium sp.]
MRGADRRWPAPGAYHRRLREGAQGAGIKIQLHSNGIAIEGELGPGFTAIEACHQAVPAMGCPRVYTTVKINTRTDKDQSLEDKVASVQALL